MDFRSLNLWGANLRLDTSKFINLIFTKGSTTVKFQIKQTALILCIATLLISFLVGCSTSPVVQDSPSGDNQQKTLSPLTIATLPALDSLPLFIAQGQGFFEDEGLEVNLVQFFNPRDRDIAFQADASIDGMIFDLVQLIIYQEGGIDLVATTSTIGMTSLIGQRGIETIADLAGQNVLMTSNTSMDYILDRALSSAGLTMDDIIKDEVPALPTRLEMLLHNHAAGGIMPDPFATMALEEGMNLLTTTRDLEINPFALSFRREVTETKLDSLQAFHRAINRAIEFLNTADREDFIDMLIETVGYPEHVRDTLVIPYFPPYRLPTYAYVEDVLEFTISRGLLTRQLTVSEIIFDIGT